MNTQKEVWKDVKNYEGLYQVSNLGRVKSLERMAKHWRGGLKTINERFLKLNINTYGYEYVVLYKDGVSKYFFCHKLVCLCFIENELNKPQINHKNGIKTDNKVSNLEWCTASENIKHAYETGLISPINKIKVIDTVTYVVYDSITEAAKQNNISQPHLTCVLKDENKNKTNLRYYEGI